MKIPKFQNKREKIDWLIKNKSDLIEMKRSTLKFGDIAITPDVDKVQTKGLITNYEDKGDVITRSVIANTYNWLDSHGDVHVGNTFAKTINEREDKIFHLHDHKHEVTAKVGRTKSLKEVEVLWKDLGVEKAGTTTVLMAESEIDKSLNDKVFNLYSKNEIDQHSVGMIYQKLALAVNDEDYEEEYKVWKAYIDKLGNPEKAEEQGYFWAVSEAKLVEYSAVLMGSNELTPTIENIEPSKDTQKTEPSKDTQINWEEVIKNF
jgi:hypothetical protein